MKKLPFFRHPLMDAGYKKNVLTDRTVIRKLSDRRICFEQIYKNKTGKFFIDCYLCLESGEYLCFRKLFETEESFCFTDRKELFSFIKKSEKYIFLSDFIKTTKLLISKNIHPLFFENIPKPYFNPIKKIFYFGINYFLIFNNEFQNNNENNILYYSNINLKEHNLNIFKKKIKGTIIYHKRERYDLLAPANFIRNLSESEFKIPPLKMFDKKNISDTDSDKTITEKNINNFFYSLVNNTVYIPLKANKMKKFIFENPVSFLQILEDIENKYMEEYHV